MMQESSVLLTAAGKTCQFDLQKIAISSRNTDPGSQFTNLRHDVEVDDPIWFQIGWTGVLMWVKVGGWAN